MLLHRINILLFLFIFTSLHWGISVSHAGMISGDLQKKLHSLKEKETIQVIVQFSEHMNFKQFKQEKSSPMRVISSLKHTFTQNYDKLKLLLDSNNYKGVIEKFWINNTVLVDLTKSLAETINNLSYVESIIENERIAREAYSFNDIAPYSISSNNQGWNLKKINADSVWQLYGINGSSILIGSMDTGVDTSHPSIITKWKGGAYAWYDAISGRKNPYDDAGHGTHTTGTLVGGDGPGTDTNDVGIAYGAKFISAKMLTSGFATIAQVTGAAQWMMDPDGNPATNDFPQVINNSWFSDTRGSVWFVNAANAWCAVGIIPVFCAANYGPTSGSTRSPGDYANCISVGGTNSDDNRYGSTSVGPSPTGSAFPSDRRKPDFSAPGEGVRSCSIGGGFATSSGTSMAAPHVTGTIALMLQANPNLTYEEVYYLLQSSSIDLGEPEYDYVFGYGRIDALQAVRQALKLRFEVIPQGGLSTSENGDSIIISIGLRVKPSSPVHVQFSISDPTEGEFASTNYLEFTPDDWENAKAISIRGISDTMIDGNIFYSINAETHSSDRLYDEIVYHVATLMNIDKTPVEVREKFIIPQGFQLFQNFPNPFNPTTNIRFRIPDVATVHLTIVNMLGQEIYTILDKVTLEPGEYSFPFQASHITSGVYYYRITLENKEIGTSTQFYHEMKKMLVLK